MKSRKLADSELILALEFAKEHPDGFTYKQLADYFEIEIAQFGSVLKQHLHLERLSSNEEHFFLFDGKNSQGENKYALSGEGTKMLFDIIEIREAKSQAKWATIIAALSLTIAVLAAIPELVNLFFPTIIKFEKEQFRQIEEIIRFPYRE